MKRFHVHVAVPNLQDSIRFYSMIFGSEPSVLKSDYAKWMLDDPRVNFAISERGQTPGINHLGFQVDSDAELQTLHDRLQAAGSGVLEEKGVSCCYAKADKYWVTDPAGVPWETFHSLGSVPFYHAEPDTTESRVACCTPTQPDVQQSVSCCTPAKPDQQSSACCA